MLEKLRSSQDFIKTSFGNILEWYDFSLYGIFAVAISHSFYPNFSQFVSLIMTLLTFSISFIARPLGSLLFGFIGDKMGKRYSVNLSIWLMAIPTMVIGIIPTYQQIGVIAPFALVLLRFIQGVSVGGQFSGLITIATEKPKHSRSYHIGLILSISMVGSLLASLIGLISFKLFGSLSFDTLTWRIPFIMSGALFIIYLKLNPKIKKEENKSQYSLKDIFKKYPLELGYMTTLSAIINSIYYILFSYSVTFMQIHLSMHGAKPLIAINVLLFISLFCFPIFGTLADKSKNRIKSSKIFTLILALFTILLSSSLNFGWVLGCLVIMAIINAACSTYLTSMFAEIFDEKYRMTACSITYSSGAVIGGFSPSIAELLTKGSSSGFYMFLLSLSFALYLILDKIPETKAYQENITS